VQLYGHIIGIYRSGESGGRMVGRGRRKRKVEGGERKCKEAKVK